MMIGKLDRVIDTKNALVSKATGSSYFSVYLHFKRVRCQSQAESSWISMLGGI